jgi:acyl-CoA synthetase (AMP-forming)/AMP-acid ligase II
VDHLRVPDATLSSGFIERFNAWLTAQPDQVALHFLPDGQNEAERWSYADLYRFASGVSYLLSAADVGGRPVLLLFPDGLRFVGALLGCFYSGAIAVPIPFNTRNHALGRLRAIIADSRPAAILTDSPSPLTAAFAASIRIIVATGHVAQSFSRPPAALGTVAMIQYTSGSTGNPKGVVLTHGNISANLRMLANAFGANQTSRFVCWLPLFHDMGLFGHLLLALNEGASCVLMPPISFFQKPQRWLDALSRYSGTISGAPDFAFEACVRRFGRMRCEDFRLADWKVAFCGAERVRKATMRDFARTFASFGFQENSLLPCYGLAEATLIVSGGPPGTGARTMEELGFAPQDDISCGRSPEGQRLAIVDVETGNIQPDGEPGEIWVAGDHVSPGYWQKAGESEAVFDAKLAGSAAQFLRTGDIGVVHNGHVFVTGRMKDTIIVRGSNIHPEDIEQETSDCFPVRGRTVAISVNMDESEQVVVIQEIQPARYTPTELAACVDLAYAVVASNRGIKLLDIVVTPMGAIPVTTSGKVQRRRCRELYQEGRLRRVAVSNRQVFKPRNNTGE